jgi:hypothetical protein
MKQKSSPFSISHVSVRCATCTWPPRSPDLTLLCFFLWGYVKVTVWKRQDLYTESAATVTVALLTGIWTELNYHSDICRTVNGIHTGLDWFIIISTKCHVAISFWSHTISTVGFNKYKTVDAKEMLFGMLLLHASCNHVEKCEICNTIQLSLGFKYYTD